MTYRDDHEALRTYHGHLVQELARLEAKSAELAGVHADRARIAAELSRVRADLDHTNTRRSPIKLDSLRVASPCKESWDKMTGDERVRDCARCEKPVFNISDMTRAEAEDLLALRGVTACVRFYRRADGTVMTSDCPVGAKKQRRSIAIAAGVIAAAAGAAGVAAMIDDDKPEHVMGDVGEVSNRYLEPVQGGVSPPPPEIVEELKGKVAFDPPPVEIRGGVAPIEDDPLPHAPPPKKHAKKTR